MTFLSAIFCWALPLVAVPIVIHILFRRRHKVISWGAMEFLFAAEQQRRRKWRLDDLLILLLRCTAILFLVLALTRPLIPAPWMKSHPNRDVIVVLDVSMSMGRLTDDLSPFERLQRQIDKIVQGLSGTDTIQVVLAAATPQWLTPGPVAANSTAFINLKEQLTKLTPSLGPADLLGAIEQSLAAESTAGNSLRITCVITDGRMQGLPADVKIATERFKQKRTGTGSIVNIVDVGDEGTRIQNLAIDRIESDRLLVGPGERIELKAHVKNYGTDQVESFAVRWSLNGEPLDVTFVDPLDPGQTSTVQIQQSFDRPGANVISCRIEQRDELLGDNEAKLILEVRQKVPVLIVGPSDRSSPEWDEVQYIMAALGSDQKSQSRTSLPTFFEPRLVDVEQLQSANFSAYAAIVFTVTPPLSSTMVDRIGRFVSAGGGIWLALGDGSDAKSFNQLFAADDGLSPVRIGSIIGRDDQDEVYETVHPPSLVHPATALIGDTARLDIHDVRIFRHFELKSRHSEEKQSVLLDSGRGELLAVEQFHGRGRVIVQAFPLARSWSNVTLCKLFVPYIQEWLRYLVQPSATTRNLAINAPIVLRTPDEQTEPTVLLYGPSLTTGPKQEPIRIVPSSEVDDLAYRFFGTIYPGDYKLVLATEAGRSESLFQVLRDPNESDLRPLTDTQQTELTGSTSWRFAKEGLELPRTLKSAPRTATVSSWLLIGLAILIGVELISICGFAWRKYAIGQFKLELK